MTDPTDTTSLPDDVVKARERVKLALAVFDKAWAGSRSENTHASDLRILLSTLDARGVEIEQLRVRNDRLSADLEIAANEGSRVGYEAGKADAQARVERLEAALRKLADAADQMPKKVPGPGGCGTEHAFLIEAGTIWALDTASKEARTALSSEGEGRQELSSARSKPGGDAQERCRQAQNSDGEG